MNPMAYKNKNRHQTQNGSAKDLLIFVLFVIVLAETFLLIRIYGPRFIKETLPPTKTSLNQIAIIIDDNGYNIDECRILSTIKYPIAVSILPHLPQTKSVATCAQRLNKEVMLHLPLEPYQNEQKYPDDYIIKTNMPERMVLKKFKSALASVPYAVGVNNHMGSKATENLPLMTTLFKQMEKLHLFFIDSRVTAKSICPGLAKKTRIPFAERDIFLDNESDRSYIENQFRLLADRARQNGHAIGIGHARALTWQVTAEQLDRLSQEGFEIVTVKQILDDLKK
jgi:uncharacterized protein